MGLLDKLKKPAGLGSSGSSGNASANKKKDKEEPPPELTPLEKMLQNAGPVREDGSDKFFGLENFGNTCYCNSIVQALYYSEVFRENVVKYPPFSPSDTPDGERQKISVQIRPPPKKEVEEEPQGKNKKGLSASQALKQRQLINSGQAGLAGQPPIRPEDKPDSPEYKKKQAMLKGPILELAQENSAAYGMDESTFTGLKDLFMALIQSQSRTGVLSPQRFLEIFKRDNEMFRNSMHQDAHEFYGLVLNDVITNVETNAKRILELEEAKAKDELARSVENALSSSNALTRAQSGYRSPGTGWVHDIFEGLLTSETKCLTCETASQRDETFLDLSIDLEEHSSVTSCLRKFSAEEMLCERNKFHCDHCGGLQEAEKRMKIKRLPKVLALHLKRFKYTEDYSRLQKLFHRVVYPYHLRMFNTTPDAEDPDRLYELYAVVVHIGGNAYHGHYVSVIKTADRGWLLFDDEMVEPVDKHFVRNFFGDKPGMACAYVLFYQETTMEKVMADQDADGIEEIKLATQTADLAATEGPGDTNGSTPLTKTTTTPVPPVEDHDALAALNHAMTAPNGPIQPPAPQPPAAHPLVAAPPPAPAVANSPTKDDKKRDKKELKAQQKAKEAAEKEQAKLEEKQRKEREARLREARRTELDDMRKALQASKQTAVEEEQKKRESTGTSTPTPTPTTSSKDTGASPAVSGSPSMGGLLRSGTGTLSRKGFSFLNRGDKDKNGNAGNSTENGGPSPHPEGHKLKEKFSFGLGRKKSGGNLLS